MYDEVTLHVCPNHCGAHFDVTVHVTQDWEVDAEGNFEKALNEAGEVTHGPQEDDCWACSKCGAEAEAIQYPETGGVYEATVVQNQNGSYTAKYGKYEFSF